MRVVVEQFLPHLLNEICGTPSPISLSPIASSGALSLSPALIAELGTTHNKRLDQIRDLIRAGNETAAESELRQMPISAACRSPRKRCEKFDEILWPGVRAFENYCIRILFFLGKLDLKPAL